MSSSSQLGVGEQPSWVARTASEVPWEPWTTSRVVIFPLFEATKSRPCAIQVVTKPRAVRVEVRSFMILF